MIAGSHPPLTHPANLQVTYLPFPQILRILREDLPLLLDRKEIRLSKSVDVCPHIPEPNAIGIVLELYQRMVHVAS